MTVLDLYISTSAGWLIPGRGAVPGSFILGETQPDAVNTGVGVDGRLSRAALAAAPVMTVAAARALPDDTPAVINGDWTVAADGEQIVNKFIKGRILIGAHQDIYGLNTVAEIPAATANGYSSETRTVNADTSTGMSLFEYCEFTQLSGNGVMNGPGNKNLYLYRCDSSRGVDNIRINQGGGGIQLGSGLYFVVEGCYIHDQIVRTPDPLVARADKKTHSDGIQIEGNPVGSGIRIYGNTISAYHTTDGTSNVTYILQGSTIPCDATGHGVDGSTGTPLFWPVSLSCVMITPSGGHTINNVQLEKNWLLGGNNSVNGPQNAGGSSVLKDNRFAPYYNTAGGRISPPTWSGGMVKSGNTNISDGSAV